MIDVPVEQRYAYVGASTCDRSSSDTGIRLATSDAEARHPYLFSGRLRHARQTAALLLFVARVARTRFYVPAATIARDKRIADPVVTAHRDRLRFESFSTCAGVYARFDALPEALDGKFLARGSTNVDFNGPMLTALSSVCDDEDLHLSVGSSHVTVEASGRKIVERVVPLPVRWLQGFAEVHLAQRDMDRSFSLNSAEAQRFLNSLPATARGPSLWAVPAGRGMRLSGRPGPGAIHAGGVHRLRMLKDLIPYLTSLRVHGMENGVSAWECRLSDAALYVVLSPGITRGFSGEGQALWALSDGAAHVSAERIRGYLDWQWRLDNAEIAAATGLTSAAVISGLARLGAEGMVGHDLAVHADFHRTLPFRPEALTAMHPRLRDATRLVEAGAVGMPQMIGDVVEVPVTSGGVEHRVRLGPGPIRCSCPWYGRHAGERGPCKHVLAARLGAIRRSASGPGPALSASQSRL